MSLLKGMLSEGVLTGAEPEYHPAITSVPQGSVLGPLLLEYLLWWYSKPDATVDADSYSDNYTVTSARQEKPSATQIIYIHFVIIKR